MECGQHRAGAFSSPCFFLCHGENPAAKSVTPQAEKTVPPSRGRGTSAQ
jgi:hypothetical protein